MNVHIMVTASWWNWFRNEYKDDHAYQFEHIKVTEKKNAITLTIDDTIVMTEEHDKNNTGMTVYEWFMMIVKSDIDPFGWIHDQIGEWDRSEAMSARNYIRGCKKILDQQGTKNTA